MTVVLVHGNPESAALWNPMVAELAALGVTDVVRLSPPGFGAPLPPRFRPSITAYRSWLIRELEGAGEPVDLVGHDWGGVHVLGVAMTRPDLLRSWTSDAVGLLDPTYVWHDLARRWQTPGLGEGEIAAQFGARHEVKTGALMTVGMPSDVAGAVAAAQNVEMARALLALYRAAAQPALAVLGRDLERAAERSGLALLATDDTYVGTDRQRRTAALRAGARVAVLEELGHWWMVEAPARAARVLLDFWTSLPAEPGPPAHTTHAVVTARS